MRLKKVIIWNQQKIVGKIFTLIGVIFLIVFFCIFFYSAKLNKDIVKTEGTITDLYRNRTTITYMVKDKELTKQLNYYNSSLQIGDKIKISYQPDNPNQVYIEGNIIFMWIFLFVSLIFSITGVIFIFAQKIHTKSICK